MRYGYRSNYGYRKDYPGGGGAFTPASISGLVRWYKPETLSGYANNDPISSWTDSAGNVNGTQGTAANRPLKIDSGLNGHAVARFDGANDVLDIGDLTALTAMEAFVVVKLDNDPPGATAQSGLWAIGSRSAPTLFPWTDGTIYDEAGSNFRHSTTNPATALTGWNIYSVHSATNDWRNFLNGTALIAAITSNTVAFHAASQLGGDTAGPVHLDGEIAEFILYNAKQSAGNRASVISYLQSKFAL